MKSLGWEQTICVECGFCCDGTLFDIAVLKPGEKGSLPQYMEDNYQMKDTKEFFLLPCGYFNGKCSIYNEKKAIVCSSFRCHLLKDFSENKIDLSHALKIVEGGKLLRNDIFKSYLQIFPDDEDRLFFRSILKKLINYQKGLSEEKAGNLPLEILIGKCNIYETLSIKYFRSKSEYNQMMVDEDETRNER